MGNSFNIHEKSIVNRLYTDVQLYTPFSEESIEVIALWDTGATISCISYDVVKELNLPATGKARISTPSGTADQNTYLVNLLFPNEISVNDLYVADSEIGSQNIGMLIGMDVITKGDFAVSNFNDKTFFAFRMPSIENADYVREMKIRSLYKKHGLGKKKRKKKR